MVVEWELVAVCFGFFLLDVALYIVEGIDVAGFASDDGGQFSFYSKSDQKITGAGENF